MTSSFHQTPGRAFHRGSRPGFPDVGRFRALFDRIALGVSIAAGLFASGCDVSESSRLEKEKAPPAVKVSVRTIQPRAMRDVLRLPGETEARHDVTLAADADGPVEWIGPREGDRVTEGLLIATVDTATTKAVLDRLEAAYEMAKDKAERREALHKQEIVPKETLEEAETARLRAMFNLREARTQYERGFLYAPIDGVVNRRFVDPGEFVNRGAAVVEIVDVDRIRINVNVPEMDVRFLKKWHTVPVTVDAYPGETWEGIIDFVAFKADPGSKTFKVRVVVDNEDGRIRPGMVAHVSFLRRLISNALAVPLASILDRGGERYIFIEKDGIAHERAVKIGVIEREVAQIVEGLEPGENLIVVGHHEVEQGTRVTVQ